MKKKERIYAALHKEEVDRLPFSIWYHLPAEDQDPISLAEKTLELAKLYDYDFIKMMPFGNYGAQDYGLSVNFFCTPDRPALERKFGIEDQKDWLRLEPLPAYYGTYGKQVQFTQYLQRMMEKEDEQVPYVQTIFSPLTTALKLAGKRVFEDMKSCPEYLHQALQAITETTINFCKANIEAGVAGFFFASKCSSYDFCTLEEYKEFGTKYDLQILNSIQDSTWFNIVHIHGTNTMFSLMSSYPVNCVNWHDRWVAPSLSTAKTITDKCLLGGLNEPWLITARTDEIYHHLKEAVDSHGRTGLIVGPGCCARLNTPKENIFAFTQVVKQL